MKKISLIILTGLMIFSLAACSTTEEESKITDIDNTNGIVNIDCAVVEGSPHNVSYKEELVV